MGISYFTLAKSFLLSPITNYFHVPSTTTFLCQMAPINQASSFSLKDEQENEAHLGLNDPGDAWSEKWTTYKTHLFTK